MLAFNNEDHTTQEVISTNKANIYLTFSFNKIHFLIHDVYKFISSPSHFMCPFKTQNSGAFGCSVMRNLEDIGRSPHSPLRSSCEMWPSISELSGRPKGTLIRGEEEEEATACRVDSAPRWANLLRPLVSCVTSPDKRPPIWRLCHSSVVEQLDLNVHHQREDLVFTQDLCEGGISAFYSWHLPVSDRADINGTGGGYLWLRSRPWSCTWKAQGLIAKEKLHFLCPQV